MDRRHRGRVGLATWVTPVLVGIGGACAPDTPAALASRIAGYATMHDTMPEAIHEAKHRAVERAEAEVARSNSAEAMDARLQRIPGSKDAWLDFTLRRRADGPLAAMTDTVTLLMNCNADSLVVLDAREEVLTHAVVLPPNKVIAFRAGGARVRVYGLRSMREGQRSESLVRTARGGDLVLRTPLTDE
ncbi:MAG: hypothetical protein HEQ38_06345 [Gemmatimonas sp.]|uniref:hypothetical protein n=1 Tax=Gemmatimonas sp. TaxID=1962908 RepID=UPI0031CB7C87|nr:hypothetical protein [Gemmatimonas sp.]